MKIRDLNQIKSIIVTMVLVLFGVTNIFSQNFVVGEFKYTVLSNSIADKSDKSIWVTGHIDGAETKGHINIPETVVWEGELYPVTGIWSAFLGCSGLTSVRIPTSVKTINDYSFAGCSGLTSITIPNSVEFIGGFAFDGCTKLTSVDIPSSVTYIGGYAFENCTSLDHITISDSEINIYHNAFNNTKWYNEQPDGLLYLNNCCLGYKGDKPCGILHVKDGIRQIAAYAFYDCSDLTGALVIPNSVISIGSGAFSHCNGFNGLLTLSNSLHEIGDGAFENCSGFIGDLILPESLMIIGDQAFYNCSGFTGTLNIPNKVSKIGSRAFGGCRGFNENLVIGNSVTYIGHSAFADCVGFKCDLIIPKSVSFIEVCAFENCIGFNGKLTIENHSATIADNAFKGCDNLNLPDSHKYVDLGLPSGTLWATCNVGAATPEGYGDYFAWGETNPKINYTEKTYKYGYYDYEGYYNYRINGLTKYCTYSMYGINDTFTDELTVLEPSDDAATVNWGSEWCTPTYNQWKELFENTTKTWATRNGVKGCLLTANNGNSLFLPAAGIRLGRRLVSSGDECNFWSSSLNRSEPYYALAPLLQPGFYLPERANTFRYTGRSVRPVRTMP